MDVPKKVIVLLVVIIALYLLSFAADGLGGGDDDGETPGWARWLGELMPNNGPRLAVDDLRLRSGDGIWRGTRFSARSDSLRFSMPAIEGDELRRLEVRLREQPPPPPPDPDDASAVAPQAPASTVRYRLYVDDPGDAEFLDWDWHETLTLTIPADGGIWQLQAADQSELVFQVFEDPPPEG